ncbi:PLAC8 family-domain-containing protein [Paraphoma chrysanthemicola]|uniref:PLAC8 family-domain-containing protein n=1 Tax=Paraphoma chrysanthemicola TaxID=798071 RepID=A0A8K0R4H3_9PLEO|nr:PLAC8 family-domain-containing protein [Paraphoma chrysanthemicola]
MATTIAFNLSQHSNANTRGSRGKLPSKKPPPMSTYSSNSRLSKLHNNAGTQNRHFSYAQTPVEHEAFFYVASPTDPPIPQIPQSHVQQQFQSPTTPIDPRPQSIFNPLTSAIPPQQDYAQPSSYTHDEKPPISPVSPHHGHPRAMSFSPVSPMPAPQTFSQLTHPAQPSPISVPPTSHARKMSNLSPINTNLTTHPMPPIPPTPPSGNQTSPLPHKTPITPISSISTSKEAKRDNRQSHAINEPYSPHNFSSTGTNNFHAVFSPDAAHGPNGLDFALHQPGQIAHPNMESVSSKEWSSSLCACGPDPSTCFTGLFCPCIVYGRTAYRLSQKSAKKDPTDMLGHSATNGHCMLMSVSCGLWWLFPMLQRTRIRHAYKLGGSFMGDLAKGCCCCCCVAVQNEREVKSREEASRRFAGPASTDVYTRSAGMAYKPQQ